jgi:hypothetical protein
MIYMAGDNNLDSDGLSDLYEIKRVGSTEGVVDIVAQFDRFGSNRPTRRYHLHRWGEASLQDDIRGTLAETNTGNAAELTRFIRWGIDTFPAEKYLVVIWAHGTGAFDEDIFRSASRAMRRNLKRHGVFRPSLANFPVDVSHLSTEITSDLPSLLEAIAPDETNQDFLDNVELKKALKDVGQPIDILGMDACLMSMAEVCYQVRGSVDITVGSEAEEDLDGWPYGGFLSKLVNEPGMTPAELAATIVDEFDLKYSAIEDAAATLSACNVRQSLVDGLAEKINRLSVAMINNFELDAISLARYRCWENELIESVDLADFCHLLKQRTNDADVRSACKDIVDFIKGNEFVFRRTRVGFDVRFTNGLGIYFPKNEVSDLYSNLDLIDPGVTRWFEFLNTFVEETEREPVS